MQWARHGREGLWGLRPSHPRPLFEKRFGSKNFTTWACRHILNGGSKPPPYNSPFNCSFLPPQWQKVPPYAEGIYHTAKQYIIPHSSFRSPVSARPTQPLFSLRQKAKEKSSKKERPCPWGALPLTPPQNFLKKVLIKNFKTKRAF